MQRLLHEMKPEQLKFIVDHCKSLKDIKKMFTRKQMDYLISGTFYRNYFQIKKNRKISHAFFNALDVSSNPVTFFWITISFFTLGAFALFIAGGVALITLAIFFAAFYYYYHDNQKKINYDKEYIQFSLIQEEALNILIKRQQPQEIYTPGKVKKPEPALSFSKKSAFAIGFAVSSLLMSTFYWALTDSLVEIGMVTAASLVGGPVGFIAAGVIALMIGVIVAYQYEKDRGIKEMITHTKTELAHGISNKKMLLHKLEYSKKHQALPHKNASLQKNQDYKPLKVLEKKRKCLIHSKSDVILFKKESRIVRPSSHTLHKSPSSRLRV